MKKISKIFLGILASALLISPSYAGEMTVTGAATATYVTNGDDASSGKTIGISNELDFTASGELDNGYTWKYQVQLDNATANNDDTRLEIGTDMGTIGIYNTEGGMSAELAHGIGALGVGFDYISPASGTAGAFQTGYDVDGYSNIQYHTPSGLLPFGGSIKLGYVPNMNATAQLSAKDAALPGTGGTTGSTLQMVRLGVAPIDGLSITGAAAQTGDATSTALQREEGVSANLGAKYTMGQFSVGYTEGGHQPAVASGEIVYYENKFYGVQFDVNDSLSVSYNVDESDRNTRTAVAVGATAGTKTVVGMEQKSAQISYTTGGATIGVAQVDVDNSDYTAGKAETQSVVSLAIAF
jgi:hypothetical protein